MQATHTQVQILTPDALALLDAIVGVGNRAGDPDALDWLVSERLVGSGADGKVTPTEAGVRATAPRFMRTISQ